MAYGIGALKDMNESAQLVAEPERVVVSHSDASTVAVRVATKPNHGQLISIAHTSSQPISITVPNNWQLFEITGARLDQEKQSSTGNGYRVWQVATGSEITFLSRTAYRLRIQNDGEHPLLLKYARIDVVTNTRDERSILVQQEVILP